MSERLRNSLIDIIKFVAILLIIAHHQYLINPDSPTNYPFYPAWIMADLFIMITGLYTIKHIKLQKQHISSFKDIMFYCFQKMKRIFPYHLYAVSLMYILIFLQHKDSLYHIVKNYIFDVGFLSALGFYQSGAWIFWYLSSLFITLPFFIYIFSHENKITNLLCFVFPLLFYSITGLKNLTIFFPYNLLRMFAGLCTGACIFKIFNKSDFIEKNSGITRLLRIISFVIIITLCALDIKKYCIIFLASIVLLTTSFWIKNKENKVVGFLGKYMTVAIFELHWFVFSAIQFYYPNIIINNKLLLGYCMTFLLAIPIIFFSIIIKGKKQ